jgi:DNA replication protein DnaC
VRLALGHDHVGVVQQAVDRRRGEPLRKDRVEPRGVEVRGPDVLKVLLAEEAAGRDRSTRELHRKAARLPSGKTFDAWDPRASAIPGDAQWALRSLDWIGRAENLVLVGPSGTGKSHFAEAIAHAAIDRDLRVSWFTLESLTATIARSRIDASTGKVVERIVRSELMVVDDIGLLPAGADEAEALYRLVDAAYEKRSLILGASQPEAGLERVVSGTCHQRPTSSHADVPG